MRKHRLPGVFIVLDGCECAGKSTQMKALEKWLRANHGDREIIRTREPGGSPFAERLYDLFKKEGMGTTSAYTQFCTVFASRFDHVEKVVIPALGRGAIVICDRYEGSTYAYQVCGMEAPDLFVSFCALQKLVPAPDITYILEAPTDVLIARVAERRGEELSVFDVANRGFYERVAEGFRQYGKLYGQHPAVSIDANRPENVVSDDLFKRIDLLV